MANIKDMIENPHPIYRENLNYWNFLLDTYEGGLSYTGANVPYDRIKNVGSFDLVVEGKKYTRTENTNLFKHKKERYEDFAERIRMSYYYNFTAPIIDIFTDHLFKQPVMEEFMNIEDTVEKREENVDRMGSSIDEFRRSSADLSQIYGHSFVLVDMPQNQGELNLQQRVVNDQFPYFVQYHPQMVMNWSLDQFGKPYWVLLKDVQDGNTNWENYDKENPMNTTYRLWTREGWMVFNTDYEQIAEGTHQLKEVPIVCVKDKPSKKVKNFLGVSAIADISFVARDVYNLCSELQEITRNQTFSFLALQGKSASYQETEVGTNKGLIYPEGHNAPQYVSPPADNARVIMDQIERQVEKMFQLAKLESGSMASKGQTAVNQSGTSKAWDFNQTNSALSKKSQNYEDGEMKMWQMFSKWEGKEFEGHVVYPNEFSIQKLDDDLEEAKKMLMLGLGNMVNQEVKKAVIKKKFPRKPDEEIDELVADMESTGEDKLSGGNGNGGGNRLFDRLGLRKKTVTQQGEKKGGFNV